MLLYCLVEKMYTLKSKCYLENNNDDLCLCSFLSKIEFGYTWISEHPKRVN